MDVRISFALGAGESRALVVQRDQSIPRRMKRGMLILAGCAVWIRSYMALSGECSGRQVSVHRLVPSRASRLQLAISSHAGEAPSVT